MKKNGKKKKNGGKKRRNGKKKNGNNSTIFLNTVNCCAIGNIDIRNQEFYPDLSKFGFTKIQCIDYPLPHSGILRENVG